MGWCTAKYITSPVDTVDSSWLDSSWPAGSNRCNQVLLAWKMLYMTLLCITSCQGTLTSIAKHVTSSDKSIPCVQRDLWCCRFHTRSLLACTEYSYKVSWRHINRQCFWRTWCNLHCQSKSMPKSILYEAAHTGQWQISLLAFNILIKYQHFDKVWVPAGH